MMKSLNLKYLQQFIVLSLLALLSTQVLAGKRTTTYMHTDALGSVVAASDEDGNLLWRKQYMPFGSEINRDPNLKELSYTGKKFDAELGLSYSGARYYDPSLGRFGGIDPVTALESVEPNPMMFNRYAYANNNPYKFIDPDGREVGLAHRGDVYVEMLAADQISRDEYSAYLRAEATGGLMATGGLGGAVAAKGLYLANAYRVNQGILMAGEVTAGDALGGAALAGTTIKTLNTFGKSIDDLTVALNKPINNEGLTAAARALNKHAAGQRSTGTFPKLIGNIESHNKIAKQVADNILNDSNSVFKNLSRGGLEVRAPNGQGLRFEKDGSFSGFLDP